MFSDQSNLRRLHSEEDTTCSREEGSEVTQVLKYVLLFSMNSENNTFAQSSMAH